MRKWLAVLPLLGALLFRLGAQAQSPIRLSMLQVQLWPEYDQPSMLVIYDFKLPDGIKLPVSVSLSLPKDAHLVAVASQAADGSLLTTDFIGPTINENSQVVTIQIQTVTTYHLEYYEPLSRSGNERTFTYTWTGEYAIDDISVSIRLPPDTTSIVTKPDMEPTKAADGSSSLIKDFGALAAGQQFPLQLTYTKTSDTLSAPQQTVQPSQPLGSNTPGRVMLSNYLPYLVGALAILTVGGASIYFLRSRRKPAASRRRSHGGQIRDRDKREVYCHQCGARAQSGDRFCRICGSQLRLDE